MDQALSVVQEVKQQGGVTSAGHMVEVTDFSPPCVCLPVTVKGSRVLIWGYTWPVGEFAGTGSVNKEQLCIL